MTERYIFTIEVYTGALLITGSYELPLYRRVSDALNSRLHRFIALHDASVTPLGTPQHTQRVPQLLVSWSDALFVASISEPSPPPGFLAPAPPRDPRPMMFFTSDFALRADFSTRTDMELMEMLSEMSDDFIPLRNVNIFPLQNGATLSRDMVCLNRHAIQAMYVVGAPITNAPLPASPSPVSPPVAPPLTPVPEPVPESGAASPSDQPPPTGVST